MTLDPEVERIFHEVADLEPPLRSEYFDLHAINGEVRRQVESLLASDRTASASLSNLIRGQVGTALNNTLESSAGDRYGPYRLLKLIGRGGMGEVWLAERIDGLVNRPVALKLPHTGFQASEFAQRAHREREILASLAHHGIARLYDAGIADGGRPFLVLEFIEGVALDRYCDAHRLQVRSRLSLFLQVLAAVQYAHSHLVIHSDLKPSNILVADDGEVKLLDFGIASLMKGGDLSSNDLTSTEHVALTPGYAAPEQIAGRRVATACDVYSLGVILFELLSGYRPSAAGNIKGAPGQAHPSSKLPSQAVDAPKARDRGTTSKRLAAALKGDLDNIACKAIRHNPDHRYATVDAFKSDLERYLAGEPVIAGQGGSWYRARKFIARHRVSVAAAAIVAIALAVGFSVALWQSQVARREAQTSTAVQEFITDIFQTNSLSQADPLKARETTARQLLDIGAKKIDGGLQNAPAAKRKMLSVLSQLYLGLGLEDQAVALDQKQVAVAKALYGANDSRVASALCDLAESMQGSHSLEEREAVFLQAKRILDRNRDFKSPARGQLLLDLAELYESTDQQKALDAAAQAVALYRGMPLSFELAQALYDRGLMYALSKDYPKAVDSLEECVSIARKIGVKANTDLPKFEALLADLDLRLLRYEAAKENFGLAFQTARALYGDEHEVTIETEAALAEFFSQTSQYSDARRHLNKALANCLKLRGPEDPFNTPEMYLMYGAALAHSGSLEEALGAVSQAVENWRKSRPGTRNLADALWWQASVLANLGQYEKGRLCLDEATAISKKAESKLLQFDCARVRLEFAFDLKKPEEASAIIESIYGLPPDRAPLSLDLLRNLTARAQLALLKNDSAEALHLATRLSDTVTAGPNRKYLRLWEERALLNQGLAHLQMHAAAQALEPLERAVQLDAEMYDAASAEIIPARVALATAYLDTGNRAESVKLLAQVESIHKTHPHLGERFEAPLRVLRRKLAGQNL